jgi:hypothetical protein
MLQYPSKRADIVCQITESPRARTNITNRAEKRVGFTRLRPEHAEQNLQLRLPSFGPVRRPVRIHLQKIANSSVSLVYLDT